MQSPTLAALAVQLQASLHEFTALTALAYSAPRDTTSAVLCLPNAASAIETSPSVQFSPFRFHLSAYKTRWDKKQETTNGAKALPHRSLTAPEGTKKERIKLS